jgi:hypothetical protein
MKKIKKEKEKDNVKEKEKDNVKEKEKDNVKEIENENEERKDENEKEIDKIDKKVINVANESNLICNETESIVTTKKNKQITRENISIFMLCQIPGISNVTAKRILDKYGHISDLIIAMKSNTLDFVDINGKKFNKNIIKNLNDYLG